MSGETEIGDLDRSDVICVHKEDVFELQIAVCYLSIVQEGKTGDQTREAFFNIFLRVLALVVASSTGGGERER